MENKIPKTERDTARTYYFNFVKDLLSKQFDDVMQVKNNELTFPIVQNGYEMFCNVTVKIPTGAKGEDYDGYNESESYMIETKEKEEKKEQKEKEKQRKIEKDKQKREEAD